MDQSNQRVSVLAVGDRFVPAATLTSALRRRLAGTRIVLDVREIDLQYPAVDTLTLAAEQTSDVPRAIWEQPADIAARAEEDRSDEAVREYTGPVDALASEVAGVNVLLVHAAPVSAATIEAADSLWAVGCVRGGPVNVNSSALSARNIPIFNVTGRNAQAVAEYIIGALLNHVRGIGEAAALVKSGYWSLIPWTADGAGFELKGRTLGLVGFGQVAHALTLIARGFGMQVVAADPYVDPSRIERATGSPVADLATVVEAADVLVLTARLTKENFHLIDAKALASMKEGAVLVNCARAELVDYSALDSALESGHLGGAILDVFEPEPPLRDFALIHRSNVLATPHMAGATNDTVNLGAKMLADSIADYLLEDTSAHAYNAENISQR